jgi:hypothetical protein
MHGAWAFDLIILFCTGGLTVVAFRQIVMDRRETD